MSIKFRCACSGEKATESQLLHNEKTSPAIGGSSPPRRGELME